MTDTSPDTPEKVLARIIDSSAPDTLLCCGATARSAGEVWIAARPEGHLLTPDPANPNADMPPAERVDLALITDTLEHLNQDEGALLLGQLRNFGTGRIAALVPADCDWHLTDFIALGFHRHAEFDGRQGRFTLYSYNLSSYNHKRAWNNPDNWANPEMWGKAWW